MSSAPHTPSRQELLEYLLSASHTGDLETVRQAIVAAGNLAGPRGLRQLMVLAEEAHAAVVLAAAQTSDDESVDPLWAAIVEEVFARRHPALFSSGVVAELCNGVLAEKSEPAEHSIRAMVLHLALVEVLVGSQLEHLRVEFPDEEITFAQESSYWVALAAERACARVYAGELPLAWLDDLAPRTALR